MKENADNSKKPINELALDAEGNIPAFPLYPVEDDIYNKAQQEENIDPENILKLKIENQDDNIQSDLSGIDLDVPGSELDDEMENIGNEDEENNSYSLGGDNHNDLEENKGN